MSDKRISTWDNNDFSSAYNAARPVHNNLALSTSHLQYVVPHSRYSSVQPTYQPKFSTQSPGTYQPIQANTPAKNEPSWCAKHMSINQVIGLLIGLISAGIPLAVMVTLYIQLDTPSSDNTANSVSSTTTIAPVIPYQCTSSGYSTLNDATRLNTYYCGTCYCDYSLSSGWYRLGGAGGTRLVTIPPAMNYCGGYSPVWFNGTLPTNLYETSTGTGCAFYSGYLCYPSYSNGIIVTNCGSFYVYYLQTTTISICSRYCTTL